MSYLDTSNLETFPAKRRLKELDKRKREAEQQIETECHQLRIDTLKELEAEAKRNNPNYIKHKISNSEVQELLINILQELSLLTNKNYKAASAKSIVNEILQNIAKNKHQDWLKKVKHQNNGYQFKQTLNIDFENQLPPNLAATYEKLNPNSLNLDKSLNIISKQIFNEVWKVMEKEFLKEENELLKKQAITDKVTIAHLERDFNSRRLLPSKTDWKDKAIEMRRQGYSVKDIMQFVGKGRTAVSSAIKSDEVKALLK